MKRILVLAALLALCASNVFAATHPAGGLGFHKMAAPIGIRWWLGPEMKMAIDAGVGITSTDHGEKSTTDFTFEAGLPILIRSWDKVHFMFRPGVCFSTYGVLDAHGDTDSGSDIQIRAELESEIFLVENFSVSASHGFGVDINSPPGDGDSSTNFGTFGDEFTNIGFHLYFLGE